MNLTNESFIVKIFPVNILLYCFTAKQQHSSKFPSSESPITYTPFVKNLHHQTFAPCSINFVCVCAYVCVCVCVCLRVCACVCM